MCDTMVALPSSTSDGSLLFAKNSDRQPNEALLMIRAPRMSYPKGSRLRCTYIEIEQAEETYEVLLMKPHWMWGAEMGSNEYGLTIGNEAVFTKEPKGEAALLGMDMLRIALERCATSDEALYLLIGLLEKYGQGGNCGYNKKFTYHNSFMIADRSSAWVLETAGTFWAAKKVQNIYAISNRLSIGNDFDLCHEDLVKHAVDKKWCSSESKFNFAQCYSNPLVTYLSRSEERNTQCCTGLENQIGNINVDTMKAILRSHIKGFEHMSFSKSSLSSVCAHGGFIYGDHTTGSLITSIKQNLTTHWVTGSSTPCISIFKPLWMIKEENMTFSEDKNDKALNYWIWHERLHRSILENRVPSVESYILERDQLEESLQQMVEALPDTPCSQDLSRIMDYALHQERSLLNKTITSTTTNPRLRGNIYYRNYWKKQNYLLEKETSFNLTEK